MNSFLFIPLVNAYLLVPATMMFAKCVPHSIEGLMMGFINSIIKFNSDIVMRLVSLLYLYKSEVTIEDTAKLSSTIYTGITIQFAALFLISYLVNRNEYQSLQAVIVKID